MDNDTINNDSLESARMLLNQTPNTLVSGTNNNDTIYNHAGGTTILGGDGNDYIYSSVDEDYTVNGSYGQLTIDAGNGNDTVISYDPNVSINGSDGNDIIYTRGEYTGVTVRGGAGDDTLLNTVSGTAHLYQYADGDGNDIIISFDASDTLDIEGNSAYATVPSGANVRVSLENGSVELRNLSTSTINITGGSLASQNDFNYIVNAGNSSIVRGSDSNDYIVNGTNAVVWFDTIDAAAGNDTILGNGLFNLILGGDGHDSIFNLGYSTVEAGAGNDVIVNANGWNLFRYQSGGGNDTIVNFSSTDIIRINDGSDFSTVKSGDNVIVSVGSGSITLVDAADQTLNINNAPNVSIDNYTARTLVSGGDGDDTLSTFANATLRGGDGDDVFRVGLTDSSSKVSVTIADFTNDDALVVLSSNATAFTYSNPKGNLVLVDNSEQITLSFNGIYAFGDVENSVIDLRNDSGDLITTTTLGNISEATSSGIKLNKSGKTLTVKKPFVGTVNAADYGDSVKTINASSNKSPLTLIGNSLNNVIKASKGGSTLNGGEGNDKLYGGKGADTFVFSKGNDVIYKYKSDDRILIGDSISSASLKGSNVIFNVGSDTLTVKAVKNKELTIVDASGNETSYIFTKQNNNLESARISSNAQLPSNDYWFEQTVETDPFQDILPIENISVDIDENLFGNLNEQRSIQIASNNQKYKGGSSN